MTATEIIALLADLAPAERRAVIVAAVLMDGEVKSAPAERTAPENELIDIAEAAL